MKEIVKMIRKKISQFVGFIGNPVIHELPFFSLFLLSISIQTLRFSMRYLIWGQADLSWKWLSGNFPRAIAVAYVFTLMVYYSRSRVVKVAGYALASILLLVCVFLLRVFGKTLQPDIIILLAETNGKESSEFLSSFLFTPGGIIAMLSLVAYVAAAFFLEKRRTQLALWGGKNGGLSCAPCCVHSSVSGWCRLGFSLKP